MNYHIDTLEKLKIFAFKIPKEGMQTHYVPGAPNKIIKPVSFEKKVFVKGSPLLFVDEEGTFICPLLPGFEKILRREEYILIFLFLHSFYQQIIINVYNNGI